MNKKLRFQYLKDAPELIALTILRRLREKVTPASQKMLSPEIRVNSKVKWMNDFRCRHCSQLVNSMAFNGKGGDCKYCSSYTNSHRSETIQAIKRLHIRSSEPEVEFVIRRYLKKDDTFVDIGACIGYYTSLALSICGEDGSVFAFEPMPQYKENFDYLSAQNKGLNLKFYNAAASDRNGEITINAPKFSSNSCNFIKNEGGLAVAEREKIFAVLNNQVEECEPMLISTVRFDDIFNNRKIDFVKMDVEGHEVRVLPTIIDFIRSTANRPHVVFEHEPSYYSPNEIDEVIKCLGDFRELGYKTLVAGTKLPADDSILQSTTISVHCKPNPR